MSFYTKSVAIFLCLVLSVLAQDVDEWWIPENTGQGSSSSYGKGGDNDPLTFFNGNGNSGDGTFPFYPINLDGFRSNINWGKAARARIAHAALASVAFVFLFPAGAIAVRVLPGRLALFVHVLFQVLAFVIFIVAAGIGLWLSVYASGADFELTRLYHPILGIVIFCLLFVQPLTGFFHHRGYKKSNERTPVSWFHISLGRCLIVMGMINGGLGLMLSANASKGQIIAYSVVAGVMWLLWTITACMGEFRYMTKSQAHQNGIAHQNGTEKGVSPTNGANGTAKDVERQDTNGTAGTTGTKEVEGERKMS
ncbi:hypothetical protein BT63DRAFT_241331 [Microthyrium microscopicum]|uniref:Cytochrome b561 domain-containing protein n=1 Tax=Microthyrium microscopicum TaxID=703497 RepID=A0A6A6UGK1_9PEZI|nr:hypothetical protein BT63DRAFT_241331 [Microthyrium microscopicum]